MWTAIAAAGAVAAAVGYQLLGSASPDVLAAVQAFAAGTILTMLASVMMPTAYADGREPVGLAFVLGFAVLGFLTTLG
jgi:ZIP family zinc transporter